MVARLHQNLGRWLQARRFIVYADWHPPMEDLLRDTAGLSVAVYATPLGDTCKEVRDGMVVRTVPREKLAITTGPWIFDRAALVEAFERIGGQREQNQTLLGLVEAARLPVRILPRR